MATIPEDGPLALARRRLGDAVHVLADQLPQWIDGSCRWQPSLYAPLRDALAAQSMRRGPGQRARLPCSVSVLALVIEVDDTVAGWTPDDKGGTVERLHTLTARGWRPQDCSLIEDCCAQLQRWTVAAAELLTPEPRVYVPMPCPRCSARHAYHRDAAGEHVRTRALKVSETGCVCGACGESWEPSQFHWLARLLGCAPLST